MSNEQARAIHRHSEVATGNPLCYIPSEALPPLCDVLGKGRMFKIAAQGQIVEIEGQLYLEVQKIELV